jgi:hypothetical protein
MAFRTVVAVAVRERRVWPRFCTLRLRPTLLPSCARGAETGARVAGSLLRQRSAYIRRLRPRHRLHLLT